MKEHNDWMNMLRNRLRDAEVTPPAEGWSRLESELDASTPVLWVSLWRKAMVAAALVAVVCAVAWWWLPLSESEEMPLYATLDDEPTNLPSVDALIPIEEESAAQQTVVSPRSAGAAQSLPRKLPQKEIVVPEEVIVAETATDTAQPDETATTTATAPATPSQPPQATPSADKTQRVFADERMVAVVKPKRAWSLGVVGGGGSGVRSSSSDQRFSSVMDGADFPPLPPDSLHVPSEPMMAPSNQPINHDRPWSLGLTVSRELGRGFSFETGLVYTMLRSEVGNLYSRTTQQLHLLGVPLRINKQLFGAGRFALYAGAGGMVELPLYSAVGGRRAHERRVQCSLTLAVGAEYRIGRVTTLYAEPEMAWYMTETRLKTIRTEDPLTLSLRAGLRFRIGKER